MHSVFREIVTYVFRLSNFDNIMEPNQSYSRRASCFMTNDNLTHYTLHSAQSTPLYDSFISTNDGSTVKIDKQPAGSVVMTESPPSAAAITWQPFLWWKPTTITCRTGVSVSFSAAMVNSEDLRLDFDHVK